LKVKLAQDEKGVIGGMIQYMPVELSFAEGRDLYLVLCIWVHGHKQGIGNYQKKGLGRELLKAAEEDVRSIGAKGIATWGISLPFFMKASWFKKQVRSGPPTPYKKIRKLIEKKVRKVK
jgi:GNAT superfamily N-acetyltransferase